jgi:hypothetical protein
MILITGNDPIVDGLCSALESLVRPYPRVDARCRRRAPGGPALGHSLHDPSAAADDRTREGSDKPVLVRPRTSAHLTRDRKERRWHPNLWK